MKIQMEYKKKIKIRRRISLCKTGFNESKNIKEIKMGMKLDSINKLFSFRP